MHADNNGIYIVSLAKCPEVLSGCISRITFLFDESGRPRLGVCIDLRLILIFDVIRFEMEGQVVLLRVSDRAHVEYILARAKKTVHGYSEGQV